MVPIEIKSDVAELAAALRDYARYSRRAPGEIVAKKTRQLMLGINPRGQQGQSGLFDLMAATAPKKGQITTERTADGWRVGTPSSTSVQWARARAAELLAGRKSAAFRIVKGDQGGVSYIASIQAGAIATRGKRKGSLVFGSRAKTLTQARYQTRESAKASGGVLLGIQALTNALAVQRRERSRFATASQFLPRRYRTVLTRLAGREYRAGQLVGVSSVDAAQMQTHERVTIDNAKGRQIGALDIATADSWASANISGEIGLHTPTQYTALRGILRAIISDTLAYVRDKEATFIRQSRAANRK